MTNSDQSPPGPRDGSASQPGPTSEALAQLLAELRDIAKRSQDAETERMASLAPLKLQARARAPEPTPLRARPASPRWVPRLVVGGGVLLLAGLLAVPLAQILFPATVPVAASGSAITEAPAPSGVGSAVTVAAIQFTNDGPSIGSGQPAPVGTAHAEPVPVPSSAGVATGPDDQAPISTASVATVARVLPEVVLPAVGLPEPLTLASFEATAPLPKRPETVPVKPAPAEPTEVPSSSTPSSSTPSRGVPSADLRVAALGEVTIVQPARKGPPPAFLNSLINRAQEFIRNRDISSARLVLEKALSAGSAQAAFHLAETYDPRMLSEWRIVGIRGDADRAKELYSKASRDGVPRASERLKSLPKE